MIVRWGKGTIQLFISSADGLLILSYTEPLSVRNTDLIFGLTFDTAETILGEWNLLMSEGKVISTLFKKLQTTM